LGLKRTPENAQDVLSFAFQNDQDLTLHDSNNEVSCQPGLNYFLISLNDFVAMIGGYEWYKQGIHINWIRKNIYPHFGVFSPTRQDYIGLLKNVKVKKAHQDPISMLEVGIGTGVLSVALLEKNRVDRVTGTDINPYAIACARDNMQRFGFSDRADLIVEADLFPPASANDGQKFDVILFNPPWIPGDAATILDQAVYDSDQRILRRFLTEAQHHLNQNGEVYLMLSNLGMLLGLFEEQDLQQMFRDGSLEVLQVHETLSKAKQEEKTPPKQKKKQKHQAEDNITFLRTLEVISLYRLRLKAGDEI
jgi:tRNA1(Val) A37 N6-methylase TrmN6